MTVSTVHNQRQHGYSPESVCPGECGTVNDYSSNLFWQRRRGSKADPVTEDDVLRAIDKLQVLGGGFGVVRVGDRRLVRSVPGELNTDKNQALLLAQGRGYISKRQLTEVCAAL